MSSKQTSARSRGISRFCCRAASTTPTTAMLLTAKIAVGASDSARSRRVASQATSGSIALDATTRSGANSPPALTLEIALGVAEDDVEGRATRNLFDAAHDQGEERVGDVGDDHAERTRLPLDQPAGQPVRHVTELGDRRLHALARIDADSGSFVDHARDGHRRDASVPRNIVNRHFHGVLLIAQTSEKYHTGPRRSASTALSRSG